jgi:hypothetical protein
VRGEFDSRLLDSVMFMKPEYREGVEAAEKFEEAIKTLFRTPKPKIERKQPKAATSRKLKNRDKD